MMIVPVMAGHIWRIMIVKEFGPIDFFFTEILKTPVDWLTDPVAATVAVSIANIWQWFPFMFLILLAGVISVPVELQEAAQVDGASDWQIFRSITLPMIKPLITLALALRIMEGLKLFDIVFLITNGGPGIATETVSMYIFRLGFSFFDMGYASAATYILMIISSVILVVLMQLMMRGGVGK